MTMSSSSSPLYTLNDLVMLKLTFASHIDIVI
jgi:hypothetical protein